MADRSLTSHSFPIRLALLLTLLIMGIRSVKAQVSPESLVTLDNLHLHLGYEYSPSSQDTALTRLWQQSNANGDLLLLHYLSGGKVPRSKQSVSASVYAKILSLPWVQQRSDKHIQTDSLLPGLPFPILKRSEITYTSPEGNSVSRFVRNYLVRNSLQKPDLFAYGFDELSKYAIQQTDIKQAPIPLQASPTDGEGIEIKRLASLGTILKDRKYWQPSIESSIQFSQNYVSSNWHKGGSSNINLFSRQYVGLEYKKDKIKWLNELEYKLSIYNSQNDTIRKYRVADDLFRLHSNFGYQAYRHWYYSADVEARTQIFSAYKENTHDLQAAFLSPLSIDFGLGMQYSLGKKSSKVYGRKWKLKVYLAPLSYNMKWSTRKNVDLPRHGFPQNDNFHQLVGSSVRAELSVDFNLNVSLQSRLYYTTSYRSVTAEWENTLNLALSRYLSTRLYLHLRYDDTTPAASTWGRYLQMNELVSCGFNYRF